MTCKDDTRDKTSNSKEELAPQAGSDDDQLPQQGCDSASDESLHKRNENEESASEDKLSLRVEDKESTNEQPTTLASDGALQKQEANSNSTQAGEHTDAGAIC